VRFASWIRLTEPWRGFVPAKWAGRVALRSERAFFAVALMTGCRQIVGIEERQVFDGDASSTACGLPSGGPACTACMSANCCAEAERCLDDLPCRCFQTCAPGDSSCRLGCSKKLDPVNTVQALEDCRADRCAGACGPWACLEDAHWQIPDPFPATITISASVMCKCSQILTTFPSESVRVRVCSIADTNCDAPLASGTSLPDGSVNLRISSGGRPLSVFLEFHKDGWLDDLLLLNTPPLSYNFDVGVVDMERRKDVDGVAANPDFNTAYDPSLAVVKLRIGDCHLRQGTGIDLSWAGPAGAVIVPLFNMTKWDAIAINLPIPETRMVRVVARLKNPATAASSDAEPIIASANMVVRPGAITLAPFVTPTP
jgi:hypothetical protein